MNEQSGFLVVNPNLVVNLSLVKLSQHLMLLPNGMRKLLFTKSSQWAILE